MLGRDLPISGTPSIPPTNMKIYSFLTGGSGDELYLQPKAGGSARSPMPGEDGQILQVHTQSWFSMSCVQCFSVYPGSRIPDLNFFHPGSASKNLSILSHKK
jgi:hypothetical protein